MYLNTYTPGTDLRTQETLMNMNSFSTWALLGAAGGAGFGLFIAPLIFILVNFFFDGVTFGETVRFALANGFTWGVFGLIAGTFFGAINPWRDPSADD